ncbi:branched-chain amino acid transport system II carrier protein [Endozoicomonas sp. OPT23]|uniref:branched-chain amino acid transport system II carrier protein n=1 Tax=Endozoicomonas sp. OPT23 TaxID=2072845 RepID=UPI00129B986A|nr:branched-chain amino acid transport system II carrier protein [Endozoicomonas sp. OPT23]MRI34964.1 branched-chain amino acid transport system II carrier protein [Endozoicomonas sp. OPT23]
MHQRLSLQNIIGMGFMVFAMFLGAGNLIFPPMAGQLAGVEVWQAAAGFLLTGVGLPLLGIIVIAKVGGGFNEITRELPRSLVIFIGSFIFIIIGPVYAVPRTGMVAYEIGFSPFIHSSDSISRLGYSLVFFGLSWYLSLYPGKLLEYIGKIITPALIILLIVLGSAPFFQDSGPVPAAAESYAENAFVRGFLEGYMTMDALAALMFGVVIVTNLKSHGITSANSLFRHSVITGLIAATGLGLVYLSLFNLGATSHEIAPNPQNGAQILSSYVQTLFGSVGSILLAAVVTLACLTTAIGCITAASEYFSELTSRISYKALVGLISSTCVMFATLGLNQIIELFIPVLLILYPVCIALILLGLIRNLLPNPRLTYRITLLITFLLSLVDAGKNIQHPLMELLLTPFQQLPGHDANLSWIAPSLVCIFITMILGKVYPAALHEDQP